MSANATAPGIGESGKGEKTMGTARNHRLLVGGKWVSDKETMEVIDKYTGETIGVVPMASKKTVEKAIGAAHAAFPSYSRLPAHRRFRILEKTSQLLAKHQDELATTTSP